MHKPTDESVCPECSGVGESSLKQLPWLPTLSCNECHGSGVVPSLAALECPEGSCP